MFHKVLRAFDGDGARRITGEAVKPDEYMHGKRLIDQRYISSGSVAKPLTECACGRFWVVEAEHGCEDVAPAAKAGKTKATA